jgi:osmotically inducible lipoprotein OsmB
MVPALENIMTLLRSAALVASVLSLLALGGCGTMSDCEKSTAIGAGIGGVAGSVLTEGSTVGTVGGAAAGGVVGARRKC